MKRKAQVSLEMMIAIAIVMFLFIIVASFIGEKRKEIGTARLMLDQRNPCNMLSNAITQTFVNGEGTKLILQYDSTVVVQGEYQNMYILNEENGEMYFCTIPIMGVTNYTDSLFNLTRGRIMLEYFNESDSPPCGECDICREKNDSALRQDDFDLLRDDILAVLALEPLAPEQLFERIPANRDKIIQVLQWLMDNDFVRFNKEQLLILSH